MDLYVLSELSWNEPRWSISLKSKLYNVKCFCWVTFYYKCKICSVCVKVLEAWCESVAAASLPLSDSLFSHSLFPGLWTLGEVVNTLLNLFYIHMDTNPQWSTLCFHSFTSPLCRYADAVYFMYYSFLCRLKETGVKSLHCPFFTVVLCSLVNCDTFHQLHLM